MRCADADGEDKGSNLTRRSTILEAEEWENFEIATDTARLLTILSALWQQQSRYLLLLSHHLGRGTGYPQRVEVEADTVLARNHRDHALPSATTGHISERGTAE
mmetsp:Transcript_7150/g.15883  ORF Transcript_7150/g.15883 Transcript_7150/m.15883 type:complete len:104 (+) Transcript_7150:1156-1467(+)